MCSRRRVWYWHKKQQQRLDGEAEADMDKVDSVKGKILAGIREIYATNKVRFTTDPEAHDIFSVEIFDIPDDECKNAKERIWKIIEAQEPSEVYFVPAVYSHTKTMECYKDMCREV